MRNRIVVYGPNILFLLGKPDEAAQCYQEMVQFARPTWYRSAYEVWARLRPESKLLEEVGQSRWALCEAHYYLGIKALGEGKRKKAKEHFQKSVDTRVLWYIEYEWSRALLGQMQDARWPKWIPQGGDE